MGAVIAPIFLRIPHKLMDNKQSISPSVTLSLMISGRFSVTQFSDWIVHRARLLSLSGWVTARSDDLLEVRVSGDRVLIDALKTACSLGPLEVQVESISVRSHAQESLTGGFYIR